MFLILLKLSFVNPSIFVQKNTISLEHVVKPISSVNVSVFPIIFSVSIQFILLELAYVYVSWSKCVFSFAFFDSFSKLSFILNSFCPLLNSESFLKIVLPFANISQPVDSFELSISMSIIAFPIPFVSIAVLMNQNSFAETLASKPLTQVERTIKPKLDTQTFFSSLAKLSQVNCVVFVLNWAEIRKVC